MRSLLLTTCLLLGLSAEVPATEPASTDELGGIFVNGVRAYERGQFEVAVDLFTHVLAAQPECARCAHFLGKSYGNLAERAGWAEAIELAKKTRIALEQAVALAPHDPDAVRDLIKYYRAAPGFLGGSDEKADELERRLRDHETDHTS